MKTTEKFHIIFNEFSRETLLHSNKLVINNNSIVSLDDDLRVGPISNFDSENEIEKRKKWMSNVLENTIWTEKVISNIEKGYDKIETIVSSKKHKTFYLWSFKNSLDILATAKLISKLIKLNVSIFIPDSTKVTIKNLSGESFSPKSLVEINSSQVDRVLEHFKKLEPKQLFKWEVLWNEIKSKNSLLRILNDEGEIEFRDETFFDNILKSFCSNEFQKASEIIANTLVETEFGVSDWFLNWRMKELSRIKKIETIGKLNEMRDYKVKITT